MTFEPIDVRQLVGAPGATMTARLQGSIEGFGNEVVSLAAEPPLAGDLLVESLGDDEGILVSGTLQGVFDCRCARCLTDVRLPFTADVRALCRTEPDEEAGDYPRDPEGFIDPEPIVRDAVGIQVPFSPLCREDCAGLCETCGGDRNQDECPGHETIDPRWSALEGLLERIDT